MVLCQNLIVFLLKSNMGFSLAIIKDIIHKRNTFIPVVFGRSACVGQDVLAARLKSLNQKIRFINLQKGRLDLLFSWLDGAPRPKAKIVKPYLVRQDVFGLIKQQEKLKWFNHQDPQYLFIDLYSELTDQKFTHRQEGWSFACHYTDIDHSGNFDQIFSSDGLLPVTEFKKHYKQLFDWFGKNYPTKKIIIVHYSAKYDQRQVFKERVIAQNLALRELSVDYPNLINLELNDDDFLVFPYHYSDKTLAKNIDLWSDLEGLTNDSSKL